MRRECFALAAVITALSASGFATVRAADVPIALRVVQERFGRHDVAGATLAGLGIGSTDGKADPRALRIPLDTIPRGVPVCLTARTRDAAYFAQAEFSVPPGATGEGVLEATPAWKYLSQLNAYRRSAFAVKLQAGQNCEWDENVAYVPVLYDGPRDKLTVTFNTSRALEASTTLNVSGSSLPMDCNKVSDDNAVQFDFSCTISLPRSTGPHDAEIDLRTVQLTGGRRTDRFAVRLP
jgi:hypothetical protein